MRTLITALAAGLLCDCTTIINGAKQGVSVTSDRPGAEVFVKGKNRGKTPITLRFTRKDDHMIVVKWRRQLREFTITSGTGGDTVVTAGNILVGGLIGLSVDAASGALLELSPNHVHADFGEYRPDPPADMQARAEPVRDLVRRGRERLILTW